MTPTEVADILHMGVVEAKQLETKKSGVPLDYLFVIVKHYRMCNKKTIGALEHFYGDAEDDINVRIPSHKMNPIDTTVKRAFFSGQYAILRLAVLLNGAMVWVEGDDGSLHYYTDHSGFVLGQGSEVVETSVVHPIDESKITEAFKNIQPEDIIRGSA